MRTKEQSLAHSKHSISISTLYQLVEKTQVLEQHPPAPNQITPIPSESLLDEHLWDNSFWINSKL